MKAQQFLNEMASTANAYDLDAHMNLISKQVEVLGIPGYEVIDYRNWYNQCQHEFTDKVLKRVSYQGLNVISEAPDKIIFKSIETVESTDGATNICGIEFIIQKEDDGQWRVRQERLMPAEEIANDIRQGTVKT